MSRIHFVVKESAKIRYQAEAEREGKSLGQWLREAADERLAATRRLKAFAAKCDARHPPGAKEPDWPEIKKMLVETRFPDPGV